MNVFAIIRKSIIERLLNLKSNNVINLDSNEILNKIVVSPPNDNKNGDIYTNAALILSKYLKKNPMDLAKIFSNEFKNIDQISDINVIAPGFINFKLNVNILYRLLNTINDLKIHYGDLNLGNKEKVNIEFASANPTGPLHIGHARGAIFSDVLANLLEKVGYSVTREYYINDAGSQIDILAQSVYLRYKEALGNSIEIERGLYPGDYLKAVGKLLVEKYNDSLLHMERKQVIDIIKNHSLKSMLKIIKDDLLSLGINHDVFTSELSLHENKKIEESIALLSQKDLIYYGELTKPKGSEKSNWSPRVQMLFKSTKFGDDVDRPLKKEDGSWTYFAADIAYHFDKISRGFRYIILELGIDHGGYVKRLQSAVNALSENKVKLEIKLHNIVNFLENGDAIKMSKREGNFLTVKDVLQKVDKDIIRFIMLTRRHDVVLDFDFFKVKEHSKDNPIFYVQYAHARAHSLIRNAVNILPTEDIDLTLLSSDLELLLIKLLAKWPTIVESAAVNCELHRISFYLLEIAEAFHVLWGYGNNNLNMRFIVEDNINITSARIFLVKAVANVIASALHIFNITPLKEMR